MTGTDGRYLPFTAAADNRGKNMMQYFGEFVQVDSLGFRVQVAYLQQPSEWYTVEALFQVG